MRHVVYCSDCKRYGYGTFCDSCNGSNIMALSPDTDTSFTITDDDELLVYFGDRMDFNRKMRVFRELVEMAFDNKKGPAISYVG